MEMRYKAQDRTVAIALEERDGALRITLDERPVAIDAYEIDDSSVTLRLGSRTVRLAYAVAGGRIFVGHAGNNFEFAPAEDDDLDAEAGAARFTPEITSPMPGKVLALLVEPGQIVEADEPLLLLEAMKMEQTVRAPVGARVGSVQVGTGDRVAPGQTLITLEPVDEAERGD